jgi:dihydropteroate synthase
MGILNVTPDSFSDGGQFETAEAALSHAERLIAEGVDIVDIGAESTRPYGNASAISADEEFSRLRGVLPGAVALGVPISIDTMKAEVAAWALGLGAAIVNDVWGLQRDRDMARVVAEHRVPVVIMHNRETTDAHIDIIADIGDFFDRSLAIAHQAGISSGHIILDPGIGFGKTPEQSIQVIANLSSLTAFGLPLLVGASRKRFIHTVAPSQPHERLGGSIAAHLAAIENGAAIVRVHDVAETVQALQVFTAIRRAHA